MPDTTRLIAGAMSGTSADGVDVALVRIGGSGLEMSCRLVGHHHVPYDPMLKAAIFAIRNAGDVRLGDLARVGRDVSLAYARAVHEALAASQIPPEALRAVAAHGQTLFHDPPETIQWLDPALIAASLAADVVSDFRRADCAAGGQGAPLVPFADYVLFHSPSESRVLLNLGGIANVTYLPAGALSKDVIAFDTGPGNCVCDDLMRELDPTGVGYDAEGKLAALGTPDTALVTQIVTGDYFRKPPPKSTDGPAMLAAFYAAAGSRVRQAMLPDLLATACLLTAEAVARAVREFEPPTPLEVFVSGGGTENRTMMGFVARQLAGVPIRRTQELGVPSAAKEAVAFALLGAATLDGVPSNIPSATGARYPAVLGSITPKPR